MTSSPTVPVSAASLPIVRFRLDEAAEKKYQGGVIGIRARPMWTGPERFEHHGHSVRVAACVSALAVRDALVTRSESEWLVIISDRDATDLGDGILTHIIGHRFRAPDEWEALRMRFGASGIDPALRQRPGARDLAAELLAIEPPQGWPPAPSGVLTVDHALGSVFRAHLGISAEATTFDGPAVLEWAADAQTTSRLADLRTRAGDGLVDTCVEWGAARLGPARQPVLALLRDGQAADVLPFGLIAPLLSGDALPDEAPGSAARKVAREARIRLESRLGGVAPTEDQLRVWGHDAALTLSAWRNDPSRSADLAQVRSRADDLLLDLHAQALATHSTELPSGLTARLTVLADRLRTAASVALPRVTADPDSAVVSADALTAAEIEWAAVRQHVDAATDRRVRPLQAAVRLLRWLAIESGLAGGLAGAVDRHTRQDAWVDGAINRVYDGSGQPDHAAALNAVLEVARVRRDSHDRWFARQLAESTGAIGTPGVLLIEDVLNRHIAPLVAATPVLLLVADGMAVTTAIDVIRDVEGRGWHEYGTGERRGTAVAALPTLTEVSRASLLCGRLTRGQQRAEQDGLAEFAQAHGFTVKLFHKRLLDSSRPGFAVSDQVGAAIDDIEGTALVACVLNTVDDALDRSDPGGTDWTVDAIKHLQPLLERARTAGRVVVLIADHGHIVERREGTQRSYPDADSNRSRGAAPDPGPDEILVEGPRVLRDGGRAVLAVDERLRYGPLKAGYHGGASPAEALVPVLFLVAGTTSVEGSLAGQLRPLGDQAPPWWHDPALATRSIPSHSPGAAAPSPPPPGKKPEPTPAAGQDALPGLDIDVTPPPSSAGLLAAVLASPVLTDQVSRAGRAHPSPDQLGAALDILLADSAGRAPVTAVTASMTGGSGARGAFAMLQRILNVEGYPVLQLDADGVTAVLDVDLLRDQFEIARSVSR